MKIKNTFIKIIKRKLSVHIPASSDSAIRKSTENFLKEADRSKTKSVYLPGATTHTKQLPLKGSAKIMAQAILKYLRTHNSGLKEIVICLRDQKTYATYKEFVYDYLNYMLYKMQHGPYVTVDMIIERPDGIVMIERSNPPYGWALPGGFVDYGETLEHAAVREAKEETSLDFVKIRQLRAYSDPKRDPRFHTIAVVFVGKGKGKPQSGDDAKNLKIVPYKDLLKVKYCFDHRKIIEDYIHSRKS